MKKAKPSDELSTIESLMLRYDRGTQDIDTRMTRKNGWKDVMNAYMSKLPANWPYIALTTDPRIRTAILEKTARLLNSKLQGRLVPREGGDIIKARINNALLDFQWDNANEGGSMIEKVALNDQMTRLFGASFALTYWDTEKDSNEIKVLDPRDVWFDPSASHVRNAKYVMVREFTTRDVLEERGYDLKGLKRKIEKEEITGDRRDTAYTIPVLSNRNLQDRVGEQDDKKNPVLEVITQWEEDKCTIFLPKYEYICSEGPNPYKHGKIPIAQLRYYPIPDDLYGESEVESVIALQRAINSFLCAFIDATNISMRPPLKISATGVRRETIEYGPGAKWIMQNPNQVVEAQVSTQAVQSFNSIYPALVAAFNTAIGDQSLGVSNTKGKFSDKTATEVNALQVQQSSRDQYNQLYLSEFLKDIMMMWLSNNKQYLFDDPSKKYHIIKIIGKDNIADFQRMKLDETDIPDYAMKEIAQTIMQNPNAIDDGALQDILTDVAVPTNPVVTNPEEENPENYDIKKKFDVKTDGQEAELYITEDDFDGEYDYIPDVSSMSAGAGNTLKEARNKAVELVLNPQVQTMLQSQGDVLKIKDLLVNVLLDAGMKDAEGLFTQNGPLTQGGPGAPQTGQAPSGVNQFGGVPQVPQAVPPGPVGGGVPQAQQLGPTGV